MFATLCVLLLLNPFLIWFGLCRTETDSVKARDKKQYRIPYIILFTLLQIAHIIYYNV